MPAPSKLLPEYKNTLKLLRIPFSFFLMPVFLLTLSQAERIAPRDALYTFLIIHLLVYPSSNGYNSYVDKDETSIGGLEAPPSPTVALFYTTLAMDLVAVLLSITLLNPVFALCILLYILASRAYSCQAIRLKKYPVCGFVTVVFFQGAFTYYLSYLGITGCLLPLTKANLYILAACSLQIAGAYPLTQIYQHREDVQNGDLTLSYKLGYRGTFIFTALMFALCNLCYYLYFSHIQKLSYFWSLQLFFAPVVMYFTIWFYKVTSNSAEANYKNTMRMNRIASVCMSGCFLFFILLNTML